MCAGHGGGSVRCATYSPTYGGLVLRGSVADFRNVLAVLDAEKQEQLRKVRSHLLLDAVSTFFGALIGSSTSTHSSLLRRERIYYRTERVSCEWTTQFSSPVRLELLTWDRELSDV